MRQRRGSVLVDAVLALLVLTVWLGPAFRLLVGSARAVRAQEVDAAVEALASGVLEQIAGSFKGRVPGDLRQSGRMTAEELEWRAACAMGGFPAALKDVSLTMERRFTARCLSGGDRRGDAWCLAIWELDVRWNDPLDGSPRARRYFRVTDPVRAE